MTKTLNIFLEPLVIYVEGRCDDIGSAFVGVSMTTRLLLDEAMKEHMELLDHNESLLEGAVWLGRQAFEITTEESHDSGDDTLR
jgi:hypothetical protein